MTAPLTPGAYITLRRLARGLSIEKVAAHLQTEPRVSQERRAEQLRLIEAGAQPATFPTIVALAAVIRFDIAVLGALEAIAQGFAVAPPPICRVCGCSEEDACEGSCWWAEDDLCSECDTSLAASQAA